MSIHHNSNQRPSPSFRQDEGLYQTYRQCEPLNPTTPTQPIRGNDAWAWERARDSGQNQHSNITPLSCVPTMNFVTIPIVTCPQPQTSARFTVDDTTGFPLERSPSPARTESPDIHRPHYPPSQRAEYSGREPNATIPPPAPPSPTLTPTSPTASTPTMTGPPPPPIFSQWQPHVVPLFIPVFPAGAWNIPPSQPTTGLPSFPSNRYASPDVREDGRRGGPSHRRTGEDPSPVIPPPWPYVSTQPDSHAPQSTTQRRSDVHDRRYGRH